MIKININEILEQQKKTMYWLSQATELTYPTIHRLANNKTRSISFDTLESICRALDCDIADILEIIK